MRVAVVGATGAFGRELVAALEELAGEGELGHEAPILLSSERSAGEVFPWRGDEEVLVEAFSEENVRGAELALVAVPPEVSPRVVEVLRLQGIPAIDASRTFRGKAPLFLSEAAAPLVGASLVALPGAESLQLARLLSPLTELGLSWVRTTVLRSASGAGHAGVEELAEATGKLLNGQEPPEPKLGHRLAFNLVPQAGAFTAGITEAESDLALEVERLVPGVKVAATVAWGPWFYGHFQSVSVGFSRPVSLEAVRARLSGAAAVKVVDEPSQSIYPMPLLATGDEAVLVGRLRVDPIDPAAVQLVSAMDNLRASAAHALEALKALARAGRAH